MADKPDKGGSGWIENLDKDVMILVGFFGGIILLWVLSGGLHSETARSGVFIKAPAPVDSGATYGGKYLTEQDIEKEKITIPKTFDFSFLKNWATGVKKIISSTSETSTQDTNEQVTIPHTITGPLTKDLAIDGIVGARESNPSSEYIRIVPNPTPSRLGPWNVSGLTVKSETTGKQETIPDASLLPVLGEVPELVKVAIGRNEAVVLNTGDSPIGISFKVNKCSGYLEQFQSYTPSLRQECPSATDEVNNAGLGEDQGCSDFAKLVPKCNAVIDPLPSKMIPECKSLITKTLTYNGCVAKHKDDPDFYGDEWRIFLGRDTEMWKNRNEIIKLIDRNGEIIDAVTY